MNNNGNKKYKKKVKDTSEKLKRCKENKAPQKICQKNKCYVNGWWLS